jgi:hypothetical protein
MCILWNPGWRFNMVGVIVFSEETEKRDIGERVGTLGVERSTCAS